jgi:hypothetical protein
MKKIINTSISILALTAILFITGCSAAAPATPTVDPNAIYTQAAQTVVVQLTQVAALTPSATPTKQPTATNPPKPTATPAPTNTPVPALPNAANPSPTTKPQGPGLATEAPSGVAGDHCAYMSQGMADGSVVGKGEKFQMFWSLKNTGTSTWDTGYSFVFKGGAQMWGQTVVKLDHKVKPGEKAEFYVRQEAPVYPGKYNTYWKMVNPSGIFMCEVYFNFIVQ